MRNLTKAVLSAAVVLALPVLSFSEGKSIYGPDSRLDFYESPTGMQMLSDSVVSFWKSYKVTENGANYDLTTRTFAVARNLCPGEKYRDQLSGAFCSGTLVGEDLVMTAGHCVKTEADCTDTKLVFGFKVAAAGGVGPTSVAKSEVYSCASIVKRFLGGEPDSAFPAGQTLGADYALIKLDRKVTGHVALPIERKAAIKKDARIFVIGHPAGLPLKVAGDAKVRDASKSGYFSADLDTFGGNSGSAVFSETTRKIVGILVRGDTDYLNTPEGCTTMATYDQTGGRGEDVTKISELAAFIPKLAHEKDEAAEVVNVDSSGLQAAPAAPVKSISFE